MSAGVAREHQELVEREFQGLALFSLVNYLIFNTGLDFDATVFYLRIQRVVLDAHGVEAISLCYEGTLPDFYLD
jgi:hypothetical protein